MQVCVVGTGYVGLVTGTCLAYLGRDVICVDIDERKIADLNAGKIPIFEPGLEEMVRENAREGRLTFSTNVAKAIRDALLIFICVGTPPGEDGVADLRYVYDVARSVGRNMNGYKIIVDKSTVPVGTADRVRALIEEELKVRGVGHEYDVVSNPEFLKEGAAIEDFMAPDRVVIGTDNYAKMDVEYPNALVESLGLQAGDLQKILFGNAARLLQLKR